MGFDPTRVTHCTDECEIWHRGVDPILAQGSGPHAKFNISQCRSVGLRPITAKICNVANKRHSTSTMFTKFLVFVRIYWEPLFFFKFGRIR